MCRLVRESPPCSTEFPHLLSTVMATNTTQEDDDGFVKLDMDSIAHQEGQLTVVMCGKVQTGKSSLINSLAGAVIAKENLSPINQSLGFSAYGTQVVVSDGMQQKTIDVLLCDTPGLGAAFGNSEEVFQQVVEKVKDADLLVYCLDMRMRLEQDDMDGIVKLTSHLGKEIWRNAVFALTYANVVSPPPHSASTADKVQFFQRSLSEWQAVIKQVLKNKTAVSEDVIANVSIVPVGYQKYRPPDSSDWFSSFWKEVFNKAKEKSVFEGIDRNNLTIITTTKSWFHYGVGVLAGVAVGAVTGGIGLGVVGAAVGGGLGGVGGGATVAIAKNLSPCKVYKKKH